MKIINWCPLDKIKFINIWILPIQIINLATFFKHHSQICIHDKKPTKSVEISFHKFEAQHSKYFYVNRTQITWDEWFHWSLWHLSFFQQYFRMAKENGKNMQSISHIIIIIFFLTKKNKKENYFYIFSLFLYLYSIDNFVNDFFGYISDFDE